MKIDMPFNKETKPKKKDLSPKEICEDMVVTLGDNAPTYSMLKKWTAEFSWGRENLKNDPCKWRHLIVSTQENIDKIHDNDSMRKRKGLYNKISKKYLKKKKRSVVYFRKFGFKKDIKFKKTIKIYNLLKCWN